MLKMFLKNLIGMFATVAIFGGISTTTLPALNDLHTTDRKSQASNIKENNSKDIVVDPQTEKESDNKEQNSSADTKTPSDNSQNNNANKQETTETKSEQSSNTNINKKTTSSQTTTTINTKNQDTTNTTPEVKTPTITYDRTTSIYDNDNITLLRVEYYKNNKLTYYSVVEQFDATTKSYVEKIYQCNRETNIDPLIRTDIYANGNLIKSY